MEVLSRASSAVIGAALAVSALVDRVLVQEQPLSRTAAAALAGPVRSRCSWSCS